MCLRMDLSNDLVLFGVSYLDLDGTREPWRVRMKRMDLSAASAAAEMNIVTYEVWVCVKRGHTGDMSILAI